MRRMQSVRARAPPPCADPPRVLVDDLHLVPSHDVMDVPLVKCASLQRIQDVLAPGQAHGGSVQAQADRGGRPRLRALFLAHRSGGGRRLRGGGCWPAEGGGAAAVAG